LPGSPAAVGYDHGTCAPVPPDSHDVLMSLVENLRQLLQRLGGYSLVEVGIELAVIWITVFLILRFLRGTRGAGIIKGLALLLVSGTLIVRLLAQGGESFQRLAYLYNKGLGFAAIALLVIFQPELRRALVRLGEARFFGGSSANVDPVIDSIVDACTFLSRSRFGALIAIERRVGLGGLIEGGTRLDADVSARLLQAIFWPNSALHDLGVVIRGDKIVAAGVQFPLAEVGELEFDLGSRHRAAVGITHDADCLSVVVSEETGVISVAERGVLRRHLSVEDLRAFLRDRLSATVTTGEAEEVTANSPAASNADDDLAEGFSAEEGIPEPKRPRRRPSRRRLRSRGRGADSPVKATAYWTGDNRPERPPASAPPTPPASAPAPPTAPPTAPAPTRPESEPGPGSEASGENDGRERDRGREREGEPADA